MVVRVVFAPPLLSAHSVEGTTAVVIDVLRATTSIAAAFCSGAEEVVPVETLEEALAFRGRGYLSAAERDGLPIAGFDFGNSPREFIRADLKGQKLVITTTNGAGTLLACRSARNVVTASFVNLSAVVDYVALQGGEIIAVCAGWKGRPNLEDTILAGALAVELEARGAVLDDSAVIAAELYKDAVRKKLFYCRRSAHLQRLRELSLFPDVKICLRADIFPVVPVWNGTALRPLFPNLALLSSTN